MWGAQKRSIPKQHTQLWRSQSITLFTRQTTYSYLIRYVPIPNGAPNALVFWIMSFLANLRAMASYFGSSVSKIEDELSKF